MDFVESLTIELPRITDSRMHEFAESDGKQGLVIELAAIHEGLTANFNNYTRDELERSLESWVAPYPKPVILNHDATSDPVGRVQAARMDLEADGSPFTRLQIAVLSPEAIQRVNDKRYITGSVGGKANEALCSVCSKDWANASMFELPCRHERGKVYKGKLAYMEMKHISWKEYSFVNVPADQRSSIRSIGATDGEAVTDNEENVKDRWVKAHYFSVDMTKEAITELSDSGERNILQEMKKKDASPYYHVLRGAFLTTLAIAEAESEENDSMAHDKDDDILEVTEHLNADLAAPVVEDEEAPADEEKPEDDEVKDPAPLADPGTDDEDKDEKADEAEDEEAERPEGQEKPHTDDADTPINRDSDPNPNGEPTDADAGELVTESEESATETEESDTELSADDAQERVSALAAEVASLSEENGKLRTALKRMLAERVIESKINLGLVEKDQREAQLTEHLDRTASSLADSLRDLAKQTPSKTVDNIGENLNIDVSTGALGEEGLTSQAEEQEAPASDPKEVYVSTLTDALMGRRKIS